MVLTVVNVMDVMGLWGESLNEISLINLIISLGITVEFCVCCALFYEFGDWCYRVTPAVLSGCRVVDGYVKVGPNRWSRRSDVSGV